MAAVNVVTPQSDQRIVEIQMEVRDFAIAKLRGEFKKKSQHRQIFLQIYCCSTSKKGEKQAHLRLCRQQGGYMATMEQDGAVTKGHQSMFVAIHIRQWEKNLLGSKQF